MKYKHIIWDWNGTLLNDLELCNDLINEILIDNKLEPLTEEKYKDIFTFPVRDYYKTAGLDLSGNNFEIMGKQFIGNYEKRRSEAGLHKDAEKTLSGFSEKGIGQSILSAYSQHTLEEIVEIFGLTKYFRKVVGLDNIYAGSKLENGKRHMKELGYRKGEVLFIGDTLHDLEVAEEIGADCVLVSHGHQAKHKLQINGNVVIESLSELESVL
ncbi:MAG: HAD family hydrolase [Melioribacteraceae bacterium]|nr:HAD family hydrolase [Melioribacteraceae bacterium]